MKKRLLLALPLILGLAAGCLKQEQQVPVVKPEGTFTGKFTRLRLRIVNAQRVVDTTVANLNLQLTGDAFKVTGDTSLHAGSEGNFTYNKNFINFFDKKLPTGSVPVPNLPKIYLSGSFQYQYDASTLKFTANNDTLIYYYDLKKQ